MASKKERMAAAAATWADATADATKKFFSAADGGSEATQAATTKKTTRAKAKAVEPVREADKASQAGASVIFSVRANAASVDDWKSYAKAKGLSMTEIVSKAMAEYQKRHTLTAEELETYKRELHKLEVLKTL